MGVEGAYGEEAYEVQLVMGFWLFGVKWCLVNGGFESRIPYHKPLCRIFIARSLSHVVAITFYSFVVASIIPVDNKRE